MKGRVVQAYLPNPGRLWELLIPGATLLLKPNQGHARISYTVLAVEKRGVPIMLHTHLTNDVVEMLLKKHLVPGLERAHMVRREVSFGHSRFDFLLKVDGREFVLEVKNCTLFGRELAMFPDAVTERASRHLNGLLELTKKGHKAGVLFVVEWPYARYFMPEYHTDYQFSQIFLKCRDALYLKAIGLTWLKDLSLVPRVSELTVPWALVEEKVRDSGCYIVVLHLEMDADIVIGALGSISFRKGYYLYVGSARRTLTKRIERHRRLHKRLFWHIDYLRARASFHKALAIRTSDDIECALARDLQRIADWSVADFGSSDCACESHLVGMEHNPILSPLFIEILYNYRIRSVEKELDHARY